MPKEEAYICNWAIIADPKTSPYTPPELISKVLVGDIVEHPKFKTDKEVCTSKIVNINLEKRVVETLNTIYHLVGEPEEGYKKFLEELNE